MMKSKLRPNATLAKFFPRSFMLAIFLTGSCEAYAQVVSPMQGGHYTMGLMNMRDLATPAPGLYMVLYNQYLWSEGFFDRNGNKINSITVNPGPNPGPGPGVTLDVNTDVSAFASVPVVMWAAKERVLGARYFTQVGLPFLAADASVGAEHSGGAILPASGKVATSHVSGFSDIMFSPVGLSWGLPPLDFTFLYTVYAPSGQYKVGGGNNTGLGFWTQQLQSFAYFYPGGSRNTALMVGTTYEFNSRIDGQDVRPGQRLTLQYGLDHYFTSRLLVGAEGGYNWQVTDDSGSAVYWNSSVHDQKAYIGGSIGYWLKPDKLLLNLKYNYEYAAQQRFAFQGVSLNLTYNTGKLTGRK